jgi:hypothetical protein
MSRGPVPQKAIEIALPIARARGFVMLCQRYHGSVADVIIAEFSGRTTIVCICRTKRLNELVAGMAAQFRTAIAGLSRVPPSPGRSCEIWAVDYYGNIRFFRLAGTDLVEIGRDGNPLAGSAGASGNPLPLPASKSFPISLGGEGVRRDLLPSGDVPGSGWEGITQRSPHRAPFPPFLRFYRIVTRKCRIVRVFSLLYAFVFTL